MKSATYKTWHGHRNIIGYSQAIPPASNKGVLNMNAIPNSFMMGASYIKRNQSEFKSDCAAMAAIVTNDSVKSQLIAASKAGAGKANTGLSEAGWRAFAEIIGTCAPTSTKLIIPADTSPAQHKLDVMGYWLVKGVYTSSRVDGRGGSRAIKDDVELFARGLLSKTASKGQRVVRKVPEIEQAQIELEIEQAQIELDL